MLQYRKVVRDPVHGFIKLTDEEVALIDGEPLVQRLRYVKQLGFVYLVYPTALHTRFDHSLGVMHAASLIGERALQQLGERDDAILRHLRVAALLHDIGHLPFSHTFEVLAEDVVRAAVKMGCVSASPARLDASTGRLHEAVSRLVVERMSDRLTRLGYDPETVRDLLLGRGRRYRLLGSILSGSFDADKLDYIMRDMYFTGATVGSSFTHIDLERIVENLEIEDGRFQFNEKARVNIEGYLITRYNLYRHVYLHHKTVLFTEIARSVVMDNATKCASGLGEGAICQYLCDLARFITGNIDSDEAWKITDHYFISVFMRDPRFRDLLARKPPDYVALWKREKDFMEAVGNPAKFNEVVGALRWPRLEALKRSLIESLNKALVGCELSPGDLLISHAWFEPYTEDLYITTATGPAPLSSISPFVNAIYEAWKRAPHVFMYVSRRALKRCGDRLLDRVRSELRLLVEEIGRGLELAGRS
jgi:HD superfamily phosphohydrolase